MSLRVIRCICLCLFAACNARDAAPAAAPDLAPQPKQPAAAAAKTADSPRTGAADAANVVRAYFAAIDARDYATAYALWSGRGQASKQTFEAFQAGFAETRTTSVDVEPPGAVEGAAGSLYVTVPVSVHAELKDGESQHFVGSYVLRRVNDVEGSSAEDRKWHLYSASLQAK